MYQPTEADFDETVALSKAHGIDPHDVTLALWIESAGYDPASMGPKGDGAVSGLNQMSRHNLQTYGLTPAAWTAMTAAQQLPTIFEFWTGLAKSFAAGKFPQDAAHLTAINFVPAYYLSSGAATNPNAPLVSKGDPDPKGTDYARNTFYDPAGTGSITVNTIGARQAQQKAAGGSRWAMLSAGVDAALARAAGTLPAPAPSSSPSPAPPPVPPGQGPAAGATRPPAVKQAGLSIVVLLAIASAIYAYLRGKP